MVHNHILEHINVQVEIERTRAHWCQLAQEHILRNTPAIVHIAHRRGLDQQLDRLLESAAHQCTLVGAVDTVSSDRHQCTLTGHNVAEKR